MKKENVNLKVIEGDDNIISVNDRKRLGGIQKEYPNMEIIIGEVTDTDKPVSLDLAEMESSKIQILDAATETILGKRVDRLEKPITFPLPAVMFVVGLMTGVVGCSLFYNLF